MTTVNDIMTREVSSIQLTESLQSAAERMRDLDVGALPVCDGETLVGMITDRDITVRGVAAGLVPADALVSDVMTDDTHTCAPGDAVEAAMKLMGDAQVRRLVVLDGDQNPIVALGDLATRQRVTPTDTALREISQTDTAA